MSRVFVSYRRSDAPGHAGRIYDRLVDRFGEANVFKDIDSMEPGADFEEVISATVGTCDALIAVIGRDWLGAQLEGKRRLDDPHDWVRLEIANALKRKIRVVPVLVQGAAMPSPSDLPEDLRPLARRHAVELSESAWRAQLSQFIDSLEKARGAGSGQPAAAEYNPDAQFNLGFLLAEQGDVEGARAAYQRAIDSGHAEQAPTAAFNLGLLLEEQGDVVGARAAYQRAIDSGHAEHAPNAANNLGFLLEEQGDVVGARAAYQRAIDSGHAEHAPAAAFNLGLLLKEQGDAVGARAAFQRPIDSGHADIAPTARQALTMLSG